MKDKEGNPRRHGREAADDDGPLEGLSLTGESGKAVAANFARLILQTVTVEELDDPRYRVSPDGVPRLVVDHDTFVELNGVDKS